MENILNSYEVKLEDAAQKYASQTLMSHTSFPLDKLHEVVSRWIKEAYKDGYEASRES